MEDQVPILQRCRKLLGEDSEEEWKALQGYSSQEVEMKVRHLKPERGESNVGTGKAIGVVDCSAEEVRG